MQVFIAAQCYWKILIQGPGWANGTDGDKGWGETHMPRSSGGLVAHRQVSSGQQWPDGRELDSSSCLAANDSAIATPFSAQGRDLRCDKTPLLQTSQAACSSY